MQQVIGLIHVQAFGEVSLKWHYFASRSQIKINGAAIKRNFNDLIHDPLLKETLGRL